MGRAEIAVTKAMTPPNGERTTQAGPSASALYHAAAKLIDEPLRPTSDLASRLALLHRHREALRLLDLAAGAPYALPLRASSPEPPPLRLGDMVQLLHLRAEAALEEGDPHAALTSCISLLGLKRILRDVGLDHDVSSMVFRILDGHSPSAAMLERLQQALELDAKEAANGERRMGRELGRYAALVRSYVGDGASTAESVQGRHEGSLLMWLVRPLVAPDVTEVVAEWNRLISLSALPWPERVKARAGVPEPQADSRHPTSVRSIEYPRRRFRAINDGEPIARARGTVLVVALLRYLAVQSDTASTVDQLIQAGLVEEEMTTDPFNGLSMIMVYENGTHVVASVGANQVDEQGSGDDIAVRLVRRESSD